MFLQGIRGWYIEPSTIYISKASGGKMLTIWIEDKNESFIISPSNK